MTKESKIKEATKKFVSPNSEDYKRFNNKEKSVLPLKLNYELDGSNLTVVGTKHMHQLQGENRKNAEDAFEKAVLHYIDKTPKEKQLIIVEGFHVNIPQHITQENAWKEGEMMITAFLANENKVKIISPDRQTYQESIRNLKLKGFTKEEVCLFYMARQVPYMEDKYGNLDSALLPFVSMLAKESKLINTKEPTKEETSKIIDRLNELFREIYSKPMIVKKKSVMHSNINSAEASKIMDPATPVTDPKNSKLLNNLSLGENKMRDAKIIEYIVDAKDSGASPFVIYGRSHIATIKPALDYIYGEPKSIENT